MNRVSYRREAGDSQRKENLDTSDQWVILGGGRLGRGFLSALARDVGLRPLLFVAGEKTSPEDVADFNEASERGDGYWIEMDRPSERLQILDYKFTLATNTGLIIDAIAAPHTTVVSTSVGLDQLSRIGPVVAEGLRQRAASTSEPAPPRLLILVCENGRSPEGLSAAGSFLRILQNLLGPDQVQRLAEVPQLTVDAMIPAAGTPAAVTYVSRGTLCVEETDLTRQLAAGSEMMHTVSARDISILQTRKLYCINTLHCLLSVLGYYADEDTVDRIATDPRLRSVLRKIVAALVAAACRRDGLAPGDPIDGMSTSEYAQLALERLQRPPGGQSDLVSRALDGLGSGRYLRDGRIDGPLVDVDLVSHPDQAPELVHAISICMYYVVDRIDQMRQRLHWLPGRLIPGTGGSAIELVSIPEFAASSSFGPGKEDSKLMETMARDFAELDRIVTGPWTTGGIAEFLQRSIDANIIVVPRSLADLQLVVFDLDEGLVATESILYQVTRDLIAEFSHIGRTISHDSYAQHVGMSEIGFFAEMVQQYQIRGITPGELVKKREERYQSRLSQVDPDSLIKPGFRKVLELLARRKLKMAICSNASGARVQATLERVGVANYFSICATPDSGMAPKPSPDMITYLLRQTNSPPQNCLVIESSLLGVGASIAAGCFTILLVNDYTAPGLILRRGIEMLSNSQALAEWFDSFFGADYQSQALLSRIVAHAAASSSWSWPGSRTAAWAIDSLTLYVNAYCLEIAPRIGRCGALATRRVTRTCVTRGH